MAVRRTKENETNQFAQNGKLRINQQQYSYHANSARKNPERDPNSKPKLFAYDPKLIINDLRNTLIITVFIIALLLIIVWYLHR